MHLRIQYLCAIKVVSVKISVYFKIHLSVLKNDVTILELMKNNFYLIKTQVIPLDYDYKN